jgi:hypothetical protein
MWIVTSLNSSDSPPRIRNTRSVLPVKARESILSVAFRGNSIIAATASGSLVDFDITSHPFSIKDVKQLKSGFASMARFPRGAILALDDKGSGLLLSANGEWSAIPWVVKNGVMCTPISFLAQVRGEKYLRAFQIIGEFQQTPSIIALDCPVMKTREELDSIVAATERTRRKCLECGMPLVLKLIQGREAGKWVRQQIVVLRNLFLKEPALSARSARYSYLLGEFDIARQLFLRTGPEDPALITNILKAITMHPRPPEALQRPATELFIRGLTDQAIDLLLMTGNWQLAVTNLMTFGKLIEAALILTVQESSAVKTHLMEQLALRMLVSDMVIQSLFVLSEIGEFDQIAQRFREASENGQAEFISKLTWE